MISFIVISTFTAVTNLGVRVSLQVLRYRGSLTLIVISLMKIT